MSRTTTIELASAARADSLKIALQSTLGRGGHDSMPRVRGEVDSFLGAPWRGSSLSGVSPYILPFPAICASAAQLSVC